MGAVITGPIDLVSVPIQFPLVFASCRLSDDIVLQSARVRTLSFTQSNIESIIADGLNLSGAFFMRGCNSGRLQFFRMHTVYNVVVRLSSVVSTRHLVDCRQALEIRVRFQQQRKLDAKNIK